MEGIISGKDFGNFLAENKSAAALRPDPNRNQILFNNEAFSKLAEATKIADALLSPYLADPAKKWYIQSPLALLDLHLKTLGLIPFARVLQIFEFMTVQICDYIKRLRAGGGKHIVCIGIPQIRTFKSNLWFTAYCWAKIPQLAECVDYVVGWYEDATKLKLDHKADTVHILYFDDAVFSGGQVQNFMEGSHISPAANNVFVIPVVPYISQTAKDVFKTYGQDKKLVFTVAPSIHLWSPVDLLNESRIKTLEQMEMENPDDSIIYKKKKSKKLSEEEIDYAIKFIVKNIKDVNPAIQFNSRILYNKNDDERNYNLENVQSIIEIMRKLLSPINLPETHEMDRALLLYWRLYNLRPLFIMEHKLADSVSIATDIIKLTLDQELVADWDMAPDSLVMYGGKVFDSKVYKGSEAFYKKIQWTWNGQPITVLSALNETKNPTLPAQQMVHCWQCGRCKNVMWRCDGCQKAMYCSETCQKQHWVNSHSLLC